MNGYQDLTLGIKGMIPYPCGCKGKAVLVYMDTRGKVSQACPKCGKLALFDYDTMTARPAAPIRGASHKYNRGEYRTNA